MTADQMLLESTSMHLQVRRGSTLQCPIKLHKVEEIAYFILSNNIPGAFDSAMRYRDNFNRHLERIVDAGQYVEYRDKDGKLEGVCLYILIDEYRLDRVNKLRWIYPDNISDGEIVVVTVCKLMNGGMFKLKKEYDKRFKNKEVRWHNFRRKKNYRRGKMNCGLEALSNIQEAKSISAFTLINLARDNGLELNLYKVELKDLPLVPRPAILHSKEHFVHIENGKALEDLEYSGYVIGQKVMGRKLSLQEAKSVKGGVTLAIMAIKDVVTVAMWAGKAILSAAVKGLGWAAANPWSAKGLGTFIGAGIGATTGKTRGWAGALKGGMIGYGAGALASGVGSFASGWGAAKEGATIGQRASAGWNQMQMGGVQGAPGTSMSAPGIPDQTASGLASAGGSGAATPAGYTGSVTVPGVGAAPYNTASGGMAAPIASYGKAGEYVGTSKGPSFTLGKNSGLTSEAQRRIGSSGLFGERGGIDKALSAGAVASAGSMFAPKSPEFNWDPYAEYKTLRGTIGNQALPKATEEQLLKYVNTPLDQLTSEMTLGTDKGMRLIGESFEKRRSGLKRQYSAYGQSEQTSSELRDELSQLGQDEATAIAEFQEDARNQTVSQAIQTKQWALSSALEKDSFDEGLALELAGLMGQQEDLKAAIAQGDQNRFAEILGQILTIGYGGGINLKMA